MLDKRLRLGTFFGIDLFVHWTFGLLIAYMIIASWSEGPAGVFFGVARLLGVFFCVTLHEYGHALTARVFHYPTVDITLLPIGGVARLKQMPRVPWQELLVAIAGPAVNVVIVAVLITGIFAYQKLTALMQWGLDRETMIQVSDLLMESSVWGFIMTMLLVNIMLVLFNMIPAFPMDGGRVLRSLLAMLMNYRRATFIASRIGLVCAALMAFYSIQNGQLMPVLIAGFIAFAGMNEARQVSVMEALRGLRVEDVLVHAPEQVPMDTPLAEVVERWRSCPSNALPVTSMVGTVVGMLSLADVAKAIESKADMGTPVGSLADHSVQPVTLHEKLETIVLSQGKGLRILPVVDDGGLLIGTLDLDSIMARGKLAYSQLAGVQGSSDNDWPAPLGTLPSDPSDNPYDPPKSPSRFDSFS